MRQKGVIRIGLPKGKKKFALWVYPETLKQVEHWYRLVDCQSKSEFIENAIKFYVGFLMADDGGTYLPNAFLSNMKSIVAESTNRISKILFKQSVELAMLMNIVAATQDIDRDTLSRLRGECVREVKRLNGNFAFEDAVDWQKG